MYLFKGIMNDIRWAFNIAEWIPVAQASQRHIILIKIITFIYFILLYIEKKGGGKGLKASIV